VRRWLMLPVFLCGAAPAFAVPITYQFVQSGTSLPGLTIPASLTIDGTFADLPTISCTPCSPRGFEFGPLSALSVNIPTNITYTLADFTGVPLGPSLVPQWWISPTEIRYFDDFEGFAIDLVTPSISYSSDSYAPCFLAPCIVTGTFEAERAIEDAPSPAAVPEPGTIFLVLTGLVAVLARHRNPRGRATSAGRE